MATILLAGAALTVSAVVRGLFVRQGLGTQVDQHYWRLAAHAYRHAKGLPARIDGKYLLESPAQAYPPLFGALLGRLPGHVLEGATGALVTQVADLLAGLSGSLP
ncbi:MAG: hypothetical protein FD149_154 [Rhodospirillaceae bacterium]|nr:MAG: hypothetical protein FD149_154 [Rhodospirillaceae bacterium]